MIKNENGFTGLEVLALMALGALISTGIAAIEGHFHGHWNCVGDAKCEGKKNLAKKDKIMPTTNLLQIVENPRG